MQRLALYALFACLLPLAAEDGDHPARKIGISVPAEIAVARGRSQPFTLSLTVPENHHVYLRHANERGKALPVRFQVAGSSGFQLNEIRRPKGKKVGNEFVLRGKGEFTLELSELAMNEFGTNVNLPLEMRVQICEEGEVGICYMPETIVQNLSVAISGPEIQTRDLPDASLPWVNSRDTALEAAKLKGANVFALISDPSRCGACAHLESKVLPDAAVNKMLRERFVLYRVPKNEYRFAPIKGSFGIPFYFVINPAGENQQKWVGAPAPAKFIERIEPYAKETAAAVVNAVPANVIPLNSGGKQCQVPLRQSFAFQATQKGDFKSSGNMRFVTNASAAGTYTVLTLDRTGEIDSSNSARVVNGQLVVEKYLGGNDLVFACSAYGIAGQVPAQSLAVSIELR